jgi:serine/threonine protein kinase
MVAGMHIASRFVLEQPASSGAMGTVFKARDLQTGRQVALKLLHSTVTSPQSASRLEFEAELLSKLEHPNIVSYIAHGRTPSGLPFLAMEWLEGEDLARRLMRGPLSLADSLQLLRGVAAALAVAHRAGVIHRDIKPSNLFLPGGRIEHVKLLDFGVARQELGSLELTRTGSILGTLEYMAPEQAQGARDVGPNVDIFSLGCVIYESLTGRSPLSRRSFSERLQMVDSEEIPPASSVRSGLPPALVALLGRMMSWQPRKRPADGAALVQALDQLSTELNQARSDDQPLPRDAFAQVDQRLLCVILATSPVSWSASPRTLDAEESGSHLRPSMADPQRMLMRWAAYTEWLGDGSLLITMTERGTLRDLAQQTARVALQLARLWPTCRAALATGLGTITDGIASGEPISRVIEFMHAQRACGLDTAGDGKVYLDELTAGLIDGQFEIERVGQGLHVLQEIRDCRAPCRTLAGHRTPCVGRERELATLSGLMRECIEESIARTALVIAPPGRGKSRLRHELLSRLREAHPHLIVLLGCGDALATGISGALLTESLRAFANIGTYDPPAVAQEKLTRALRLVLSPQQLARTLVPLCELGTQQLVYDGSAPTTLHERGVLREQIEQAFVQFMTALTAIGPVLFVIEDLQFVDALSVRVLHRMLGELEERPLMVLGLGRPEVHSIFPKLWTDRRMQELRLEPLLPPAAMQLVESVLGRERAAAVAPHILEHGRGNALYLEELLITSVEHPHSERLPETLVALKQGRLLCLPLHAVRVIRAAALFGMTFWEEGIHSLLLPLLPPEHIDSGLQILLSEQLITRQRQSRFPHTTEYRFRHGLTLVAAKSLLSQRDRDLGSLITDRYR